MLYTQNISFWSDNLTKKVYPTLNQDIKTEVLVIGGGISGITVATMLKEKGLKTVLIEANQIISGASANTTAKITAQHRIKLNELIKKCGKELAKQYLSANINAIDIIQKNIKEHNINCDFKRTYSCVITEKKDKIQDLEKEAEATNLLGINATYIDNPQFDATKNANILAALKYYNQAQFNPAKYLNKLAEDFNDNENYFIYENTRAIDITKGKPNIVFTDKKFKILADYVVLATHFPFYDRPGLYFTRLYPQRSYIYSFTAENTFSEGMFITAENGYSLRSVPYNNENLILIGGGNHDCGKGYFLEKNYKDLQETAKKLFTVKKFLWKWSSQDYSTPDNLPYAGLLTSSFKGIYTMTGYDKWGMTNATAAADIICSLILQKDNPYKDAYSPHRMAKSFYTIGKYLGKNSKTIYRLFKGRIKKLKSNITIKKGEGRLVKLNKNRAGIYKDDKNNNHIIKSVCSHMGCGLTFNDAEKTWDCPCHGSRFDIDGNIIEGPATKPLKKLKKSNYNNV